MREDVDLEASNALEGAAGSSNGKNSEGAKA